MPVPRAVRTERNSRTPLITDVAQQIDTPTRSSSASQIALLWKPTAATPSSPSTFAPSIQIFLAFWLGGLFCSIILPRLAFVAWGATQALRRRTRAISGKRRRRDGSRGRRRKRGNKRFPIDFTTINRKGLFIFQHIGEQLVGLSVQTQLRKAFEGAFAKVENPNIRMIEVHGFEMQSAPRFHSGRVYDLGKKALAFDADADWNDAFDATVTITTQRLGVLVPVRIHNVKISGPFRVILTPLIEYPPGFGANLFRYVSLLDLSMLEALSSLRNRSTHS